MLKLVLMLAAALFGGHRPHAVCTSTIFGYEGDQHAGGDAILLGRPVNDTDMGIAHRYWKMGSDVAVQNVRTGRVAYGKVLDRGPYGALTPEGKVWFPGKALRTGRKTRRKLPKELGRWRGCADLTPALARAIGHDGMDRVRIWRVKRLN